MRAVGALVSAAPPRCVAALVWRVGFDMGLRMIGPRPRRRPSACGRIGPPDEAARPLEIGRSIDTERNGVNDLDVDAHAGFERAQLLELLALLQHRRLQGNEARQRRPAVRVYADVVIKGAFTIWRRRSCEVE